MSQTPRRIMREPEVVAVTGYSRATLRRRMADGDFPKPLKLGRGQGGAVGWFSDEVDQWLTSRPRVNPPEAA